MLVRRFRETRRPHPLMAANGILDLNDAIDEEEKQLAVLRGLPSVSSIRLRCLRTSCAIWSPHYMADARESPVSSPCRLFLSVSNTVLFQLDLLFDVRFCRILILFRRCAA